MEVLVILLVLVGAVTQMAVVGSVMTKGGNNDASR